ncbi:PTS sugar transporter subunit IIB [Peptacetobacter sp.]|uniref:PTS sugar transporter subunit IIB n=1 Tax=Peptacetobacter sp. TaxID=2991975 RepID=UPI00261A1E87|nr:PTS sugar transporter subunit IIB [Peptacetobacter sp.]
MRIVLCCAGGFSTTMLMENMKKTVKESKKLDESKFDFIAIPVDTLSQEIDNCDVLVIGPQIAHKLESLKPMLEEKKVPYTVIDRDTYGKMDGATAFKMALIAHKKANM